MGRATRWLKGLLPGSKKDSTNNKNGRRSTTNSTTLHGTGGGPTNAAILLPPKERRRWSFTKSSGNDNLHHHHHPSPEQPTWLRSLYRDDETAQNKHAIAVAAATAAAADAAVAAATAAIAVVRLTNHGRGSDRLAAVKIQTAFRGYLAKKALRALKGLVKLQALVRGYLVRKQAAATLQSMQALIRAQTSIRMHQQQKLHLLTRSRCSSSSRPRRSLERWEETRSEQCGGSLHIRRLSGNVDGMSSLNEESPKIVEVDPGRPRSRGGGGGRRSESSTTEETTHYSSPLARLSIPLPPQPPPAQETDWWLTGEEWRFSTAQSTPRFSAAMGAAPVTPVTPAKSACGSNNGRYHNYMANTQSSKAKVVRSQSAPKQRPEPRKKMSLSELVESRVSLSGVRMQKTCSTAREAVSFKNTIVGRLERSSDPHDHYYLQRKW